jgi:hypothetical protein
MWRTMKTVAMWEEKAKRKVSLAEWLLHERQARCNRTSQVLVVIRAWYISTTEKIYALSLPITMSIAYEVPRMCAGLTDRLHLSFVRGSCNEFSWGNEAVPGATAKESRLKGSMMLLGRGPQRHRSLESCLGTWHQFCARFPVYALAWWHRWSPCHPEYGFSIDETYGDGLFT